MRRSLAIGYTVLALAQTTISINVVTGKHLLTTMPMFLLLVCRFGLSTFILGAVLVGTRSSLIEPTHPQKKLTFVDWSLAILAGFLAAFLFNILFVWGLQHTTATAAGIVGSTLPAIIALSAIWWLKERLNTNKVTALVLAMLGILIINLDHLGKNSPSQHTYFGDFLIFLAMIPEAWYSIISRKLAGRVTPLGAAFIANCVGFASFLPCAYFSGAFASHSYSLIEASFITVAALSSVIFFWAWGWGLSFIPASTAAIFGGIMPVATAIFAIVFLHEQMQWYDVIGMLLVLSSIFVGTKWRGAPLQHPSLQRSSYIISPRD